MKKDIEISGENIGERLVEVISAFAYEVKIGEWPEEFSEADYKSVCHEIKTIVRERDAVKELIEHWKITPASDWPPEYQKFAASIVESVMRTAREDTCVCGHHSGMHIAKECNSCTCSGFFTPESLISK
jgi:predicted phosphohydrolase